MGGSQELSLYLNSTEAGQIGTDAHGLLPFCGAEVEGECRHRLKDTRVALESPNHLCGITLRLCFWFPGTLPGTPIFG